MKPIRLIFFTLIALIFGVVAGAIIVRLGLYGEITDVPRFLSLHITRLDSPSKTVSHHPTHTFHLGRGGAYA